MASIKLATRTDAPVVVDLFAGAGLFSAAFREAGFHLAAAIELDPVACKSYQLNLGGDVICGDVREVNLDLHCDVLVAGPPCQGFSTLNRSRHTDQRRWLALEVAEWARRLRPAIVCVENVLSFIGTEAHSQLVQALQDLGYLVEWRQLDAVDFGVAQYRKRSFTIASMLGPITWPVPAYEPVTVRSAWKGLSPTPTSENLHFAPVPSDLARARMEAIPAEGSKISIIRERPELAPPSWFRSRLELTDVWGRLAWDKPSNTLRTCLQNPSKGRYIHPEQDRVITLREAARLHSIDDQWRFAGTPTQIARQIGNSVPPMLGRSVAAKIYSMF